MPKEIGEDISEQLIDDLACRISESSFGDWYDLDISNPITCELARALYQYQNRQAHNVMERRVKKNEALRAIQTHSTTLSASLHHALCSSELATDLSKGYAEALEELPPGTAFIHNLSENLINVYEGDSRAGEQPLMELWGLVHRMRGLAIASNRVRSNSYGNPRGAPPKELTALIKALKQILERHNETLADEEKIREDAEFAACICELLGLIGGDISKKSIRNTLSSSR